MRRGWQRSLRSRAQSERAVDEAEKSKLFSRGRVLWLSEKLHRHSFQPRRYSTSTALSHDAETPREWPNIGAWGIAHRQRYYWENNFPLQYYRTVYETR